MGLRESLEDETKRSPGLDKMLKEIIKYGSQKVKDEVFEFAPDYIQRHYGYVVKLDTESKVVDVKKLIREVFK